MTGTYFCLLLTKEQAAISGGWGMVSSPARLNGSSPSCHPAPAPHSCLGHLHPSRCMGCSAPQMPPSTRPSKASCRSSAWCNLWAAHPQSGDKIAQEPPGSAPSITCFPACTPKSSLPNPALRHLPQGCRPRAKAHVPGLLSLHWACVAELTDSAVRRGKETVRCPQEGQHPRAQGTAPHTHTQGSSNDNCL